MTTNLLFPLAQWLEGTNQNSTPANDNALRIFVAIGPAIGFTSVDPGAASDYDQYVIGTDWGGFSANNIIVWLDGAWKEYYPYDGQIKAIDGLPYVYVHSVWELVRYIGDGHSGS